MEIIVVDLAIGSSAEASCASDRRVVWCKCSPRLSYGEARAEGARRTRGPIVAFIEDHCYAERGWAAEVIKAFEQPVDIVSYGMMSTNDTLMAQMFTLCEYGRWMVPAISGRVPISSCHNVAYRRTTLEPYWTALGEWLDGESLMCRAMQKTGASVWLAGDAKVAHESWSRLSTGLHANRTMKRVYAAQRATRGHFGAGARVAWAAAMTLTPPLHIARVARSLIRRPQLWPLFWISLPLMLLVYAGSAQSEAAGYLFGEGDSRDEFRDLEISIERQV